MLAELDWIVEMVKAYGTATPKTIVFCPTLYAVSSVINNLIMQLGPHAFHHTTSHKRKDCLLGIFHTISLCEDIATISLSMGVNFEFPNIRFIVSGHHHATYWIFIKSLVELEETIKCQMWSFITMGSKLFIVKMTCEPFLKNQWLSAQSLL